MRLTVLRAYLSLVLFQRCLTRVNFERLYDKVRRCESQRKFVEIGTVEQICAAMDTACIWYCKEVRCLQRSAATAWLLKRNGIRAHLVIGVQQTPFRAHAWVEVAGRVVNDKPYINETYTVIDRC